MAADATLTQLLDTERAMRDRVLQDVRAGVVPGPGWPSLHEYHAAIVARVRYEEARPATTPETADRRPAAASPRA